jgi:hypothetical protein
VKIKPELKATIILKKISTSFFRDLKRYLLLELTRIVRKYVICDDCILIKVLWKSEWVVDNHCSAKVSNKQDHRKYQYTSLDRWLKKQMAKKFPKIHQVE